jgi:serine/threonine protein kinase
VYLAQDTRLDRKVALKILPADLAANQDRMRRFKQEATAVAALNHPNIAPIYKLVKATARTSSPWSLSTARLCGKGFTAEKGVELFYSPGESPDGNRMECWRKARFSSAWSRRSLSNARKQTYTDSNKLLMPGV